MKLRIYRADTVAGYRWFMDHGKQKCEVSLKLEAVGWAVKQCPQQEYLDIDVEVYGQKYQISTQWGKLSYIEHYLTNGETQPVDEFFISDGHPAAEFLWKEITFDDGVERVVRIAHTKPTQPY